MENFSTDELYFRITYFDRALTMPSIEVFRYIGLNLSDEDVEETAYFQLIESYANGSNPGGETVPKQVTEITERNASEMLNLEGLIKKLRAVDARMKSQK